MSDLVEREAVLKLKHHKPEYGDMIYAFDVEQLPSVTQKPETVTEFADRCRECGAKYGKLLKQEPCEDCISRQAVEEIINDIRDCISVEGYWAILERMKKLPSVKPQPCEDAVNREWLKKKLQEHYDFFVNAYGGFKNMPQTDKARVDEITNCIAEVVNAPSGRPQEQTGHWIDTGSGQECSECHEIQYGYDNYRFYCGNCGAKMVEPHERSDKE